MNKPEFKVRPLSRDDLPAVVEIDAAIEGRSRSAYIERRLAAALRTPATHAQFAIVDGKTLVGYILARVIENEFGRGVRGLRLELVGVRPDSRGKGAGRQLFNALAAWAKRHDVVELRTAARWNHPTMLHWLDSVGFERAGSYIVDCSVDSMAYDAERDDAIEEVVERDGAQEVDFSARDGNDFERANRATADVRTMKQEDLATISRIDQAITGRDRSAYLRAQFEETLSDEGLRVSLVARNDGGTVVGYLMASVDRGDFGRTAPVAILDTLGVDPRFTGKGVGRAMLAQLFTNLGALRVEHVETIVAAPDMPMYGFLAKAGFGPSKRLPFVHHLQ